MFKHHSDDSSGKLVFFHWFLLCFNAGSINAEGFLATGRFVSHVTGFATLFGVDVANGQYEAAISIISAPLFFLIGSFLAGLLIDRPIYLKKRPHFDYVMGLSALCLFLSATGGELSLLGFTSGAVNLGQIYFLLVLLCLACGLQNGAITTSSGSSVRTTHLTGLMTDLGLGIARLMTLKKNKEQNEKLTNEKKAALLRGGSILAFIFGSVIGSWLFIKIGHRGFVFSGLIASYAAWEGRKAKISAHKNVPI